MSSISTTTNEPTQDETLSCCESKFQTIEIPKFDFHRDRWSTTREENVERTAAFWKENPMAVRVFEDPKFSKNPLVMMRKGLFEKLYSTLEDIASGRAGVLVEIQQVIELAMALTKTIADANDRVPDHVSSLSQVMESNVTRLLATFEFKANAAHSFVTVRPPKSSGLPSVSEEELANIIAELEEEEREDIGSTSNETN